MVKRKKSSKKTFGMINKSFDSKNRDLSKKFFEVNKSYSKSREKQSKNYSKSLLSLNSNYENKKRDFSARQVKKYEKVREQLKKSQGIEWDKLIQKPSSRSQVLALARKQIQDRERLLEKQKSERVIGKALMIIDREKKLLNLTEAEQEKFDKDKEKRQEALEKLNEKRQELEIKRKEEKKELIKKKIEGLGQSAGKFVSGALTLKKPKAKLPSYSPRQFLSNLARQQGGLVSQQDPLREQYENPQVENRSLFFRDTFKKEKEKAFGGFL